MIRQNRDLRQNAQAHAGGNGGLDAGEVRTGIGHVPGTAGALQRMDRARAVEAARRKSNQRHRARARIARMGFAGHPVHALRPHRDAAFFAGRALEQRQINLAAFEVALEVGALVGTHVEPQAGMRARKRRQ